MYGDDPRLLYIVVHASSIVNGEKKCGKQEEKKVVSSLRLSVQFARLYAYKKFGMDETLPELNQMRKNLEFLGEGNKIKKRTVKRKRKASRLPDRARTSSISSTHLPIGVLIFVFP